MTEINNNTNPPVSFDVAQRFLADFNFCFDYWESYGDDCMNYSKTPAHSKVLGQLMQSLLESSEQLLEALYDSNPIEFYGYCANTPQREITESETQLLERYLKTQ